MQDFFLNISCSAIILPFFIRKNLQRRVTYHDTDGNSILTLIYLGFEGSFKLLHLIRPRSKCEYLLKKMRFWLRNFWHYTCFKETTKPLAGITGISNLQELLVLIYQKETISFCKENGSSLFTIST